MRPDPLLRAPQSKHRRGAAVQRARRLLSEGLEDRFLLAQTTGLFFNDPNASDGYVLLSPNDTEDTYLIDKQGNPINEWNFSDTPGLLGYLQPDGSLVRSAAAASGGQGGNGVINAAGAGGRIEWVEWDGTPRWSFDYGVADTPTDTRSVLQHHDFEVLPSGNILLIAWEFKTEAEAIAAGRNPATVSGHLYPDHIVEVDPDTDQIVWEWYVWDHLVQDFDATKDNYFGPTGVADNPGKIDINFTSIGAPGGGAPDDWTHANGIDYNPDLDQIVLSVREFSEFWVIDHNTTTEQAAGPAGDLLYRWGNPQAYGRGDAGDRELFYQHDAKWVTDDSPGAGNITVFNNGFGRPAPPDFTTVDEITTPVDGSGNYPALAPGEPHGPDDPTWRYTAPLENFSAIISGTQRLENGNTLITYGVNGTFSEVTPDGDEVWKYVSPYIDGAVLGPEDPIPNLGIPIPGLDSLFANFTFRATHYPVDYAPQFETVVTGRHAFYNESRFDAGTADFDEADSNAIASDKNGYVPGSGLIGPESVTSYSKGINGIMIDIAVASGPLGLGDFAFKMSEQGALANNAPSTWVAAPAPTMTVLADTPSPGTNRVGFIWPDNAIENRYLEVTVKGDDAAGGFNTNTGLAATEVFYFGNRIGDDFLGTPQATFETTVQDEIDARSNAGFLKPLSNIYDYNKDSLVSAADQIIARNNTGSLTRINIGGAPAFPAAAPDGGGSVVAAGLTAAADSQDSEPDVASRVEPVSAPRRPDRASARRFFHQLGEASDARRRVELGTLDALIEALELDNWLVDMRRR